ncbi:DUF1998 domain-containing protein [Acidimicrobiia bacterium]|jgi:hypothetical protein|nr:DUF1998 domain-containing protein [Acidimicrobiia bacterium]
MADDIRLSQITGTFGVGSLRVQIGGLSMIAAGLDHWYQPYTLTRQLKNNPIDEKEFVIYESRLQSYLDVDYFKSPPEYRDSVNAENTHIPVPFFRFPKYSYCSFNQGKNACGRLQKLRESDKNLRRMCQYCAANNRKSIMYQVNLVVACKKGHVDEFPWSQWAHNTITPKCDEKNLIFLQSAGSGVRGQKVKCIECNKSNDLSVGFYKLMDEISKCKGSMPWHGNNVRESCDEEVIGMFTNQTSLYQPTLKSSLFIPVDVEDSIQDIDLEFQNNRHIKYEVNDFFQDCINEDKDYILKQLEKFLKRSPIIKVLSEFTEESIREALLQKVLGEKETLESNDPEILSDQDYRYQEYKVLEAGVNNKYIKTETTEINNYSPMVNKYINKIVRVESILQTTALTGFSRRGGSSDLKKGKKLLWRNMPNSGRRWLPATQNYGEGLFIDFNSEYLKKHTSVQGVKERLEKIENNLLKEDNAFFNDVNFSIKLLFTHTLSHLLINEIIYESGYGSASIGERLFVSPLEQENEMNGLLIYTAQGDTEGTMGGLVSLGNPERFNIIFENALKKALWCSTDPVCNEVVPQGPFNLNLGACYSCALLPETSCELINSILDRGIVVGTQSEPHIGVIQDLN